MSQAAAQPAPKVEKLPVSLLRKVLVNERFRGKIGKVTDAEIKKVCTHFRDVLRHLQLVPYGAWQLAHHYTASPYPPVSKSIPKEPIYWINYLGIRFAIPAGSYMASLRYEKDTGEFRLYLLMSEGGFVAWRPMEKNKPMKNIFKKFLRKSTTEKASTKERAQWYKRQETYTRYLFGKYPRTFDLLDVAYQVTPKSFNCKRGRILRAMRDLVVMHLKVAGIPKAKGYVKVHRNIALPRSILRFSDVGGNIKLFHFNYVHKKRYYTWYAATNHEKVFKSLKGLIQYTAANPWVELNDRPVPLGLARLLKFANKPSKAGAKALLKYLSTPREGVSRDVTIQAVKRYLLAQKK